MGRDLQWRAESGSGARNLAAHSISSRALRRVLCGVSLLASVTCGGARRSATPAEHAGTALHQGPLTDFVPAAGLRWMVVVRPRELLEDRDFRAGIEQLFPDARLDVFARNSGVDLRTLNTGLVAGFDLGTLYLAETATVAPAKQAFLSRLASEPVEKHLGSGVQHVTGLIGTTPESLIVVPHQFIGVSVNDPTLTKIAGAFALRKLKKSPSALFGAALSALPSSLSSDPIQFYAPGPFSDDWAQGAHGLLRSTVAIGITGRVNSPGTLDVLLQLEGEYAEGTEATTQKALSTFRELADSALGRVLSLNDPSLAPEFVATPRQVNARVRLPIKRLLDGLHAVVSANVWDLLDYTSR